MKVKKLCTLMTIFALMAIFSIIGVQAEGNAAKIAETGKEYATFVEAVNAAESGQTVELLQDASFSGEMKVSKNITINGAGKVLTDNGAIVPNGFSIQITEGEVTVKNITLKRDNKKSYAFFWLPSDTGGVLTLSDDVIFDSVNGGNGSAAFLEGNERCKLNVTGSNVALKDCDGGYGVIALLNNSSAEISNITMTYSKTGSNRNGIGVFNRSQLTMNAGMISGYMNGVAVGTNGWGNSSSNVSVSNLGEGVSIQSCSNAGIALGAAGTVNTSASISGCTNPINISGAGTININGGEITGTQKVINATGGTVNVKAGTVTGTANVIAVEGGSVNITGGEINGNNDVVRVSKGTVNIMGGTVNVANSAAINATGGTVNISGGTVKGNTNLVYTNDTKAVVNVKGGSIESTGVSINADNGTVNISSGTINANGSAIYMAGAATAVVEINGGTISGSNTAKGIHLASGTVNMKNGTIKNFEYGIRVLGGTLNVSGGTIESCKFGIGAEKGTVSMTGGTIRNCKSTTGTPGMGIYVNKTDALNVNVSGGTITGCDSGLNIADNNEATLAGDVTVTGNTGSNIWVPGAGKLYISGKFNGTIRIKTSNRDKGMTENVIPASDFEGIRDLSCITNDYDQSFFGYCNMETKTFGWTKHPEVAITATDSGVYKTANGETFGVVRFISEFLAEPTDAIEYFGTYVIKSETPNVSGDASKAELTKFESSDITGELQKGINAYAVDAINIAQENFNTPVVGISFVKLKGIDAPKFITAIVENVNIDKNLGISDGTNFAAQE